MLTILKENNLFYIFDDEKQKRLEEGYVSKKLAIKKLKALVKIKNYLEGK
jgi:hypothetical protein